MERYSNLGEEEEETREESLADEQSSRFSEEEIQDGMDGARFSYLFNFFGVPFCLIPLLRRENAFSLFHAKQAVLIWGLFFVSLGLGWLLLWISLQAMWLFLLGGGVALTLNVMGHQCVIEEKDSPLPLLGPWAEKWFRDWKVDDSEDEKSLESPAGD